MPSPTCSLRSMHESDGEAVLRIYAQGIETGHATFAHDPGDWSQWDAGHLTHSRLVACQDECVIGWAALSPTSSRCVYGGVAEVSVYVAKDAHGLGLGAALLAGLIHASEQNGIWTLQAGIFPENIASLSLHEKYGFETLGTRKHLGKMEHGPMRGQWRDVVLMERRSNIVGCDQESNS